jgi:type III restriction enzyme
MIKEVAYQRDAVKELVDKTIKLLGEAGDRKKLVFKAPTGSGKTVMASQMLDELTTQLTEVERKVAIIWIAPNKLHEQSYMRMKNYFSETRVLRPVMYDEIDHSNNGYIKPGEIFFVNWESINKDDNIMVRDTENSSSLYDIVQRTKEEHGLPVIVVIDEEHMFGGNEAQKSEKVLRNINPKLEIRISATPITQSDELVSVSRDSVIKEEMIKDGITINPLLKDIGSSVGENEYLLDQAVAKRNEIKAAYEALGVRINPLLLIQLPNDNTERVDEDARAIIEMVKVRLCEKFEITTENGKLAVWLANDKENLEGLENDYNLTEVLLFKQAIALGWDCPRAAVLLIYRDIKSTIFGVQTVGRIMRMPEQKYYTNQILNHGWVYTNLSRDRIEIVADDMNYITKALTAYRRKDLNNVSLPSAYCERLSADRNRLGADFWPILVNTFNTMWFKQPIQQVLDFSPFEEGETQPAIENNDTGCMIDAYKNRQQAKDIAKIDFDNHGVQIQLASDVEITGEAGTTLLGDTNTIKYAKSQKELKVMFNEFCAKIMSGFEKISITSLRGYIYQLMEEFLGVSETDTPRIILYYRNKSHFEDVIRRAVAEYVKKIDIRRNEAKQRSFKEYTWTVPEAREYNETVNETVPEVMDHALMPFVRLRQCSLPEKRFETFLEDNKEYIDWWYKNGDEGQQHYAISYTNNTGEKALFYVDFIIRMKYGQIFLFDTKSQRSDPEAANKHNALIDYINLPKNENLHLLGGVLIEEGENWYWAPSRIKDTENVIANMWRAFHPDEYNA